MSSRGQCRAQTPRLQPSSAESKLLRRYLLKKDWAKHRSHVTIVNKQYCLNCYWRDLLDLGDLRSDESRVRSQAFQVFACSDRPCSPAQLPGSRSKSPDSGE